MQMEKTYLMNLSCGRVAALAATLLTAYTAFAGDESDRVTEIFSHFDEGKQPGVAVLVMQGDDVVYSRGFGYANLDDEVRITPRSMFRLASVSKQMTTMAAMRLAEAGKLEYDDPVTKYFPELDTWPGVTIRHLMWHTSGIPDYYEEDYYREYDQQGPMPQMADLLEILQVYREPEFAPGEKYVYNNAAYELLALIIGKVAGMPFHEAIDELVFKPAGMKTALAFNTARGNFANRVTGYTLDDDGYSVEDFTPFDDMLGSGGYYASLKDMTAWTLAVQNYSLIEPETQAQAWTRGQLNDGTFTDDGFGWEIGAWRDHFRTVHTGSWNGFRNIIWHLPDEKFTIVILGNRTDLARRDLARQVAAIYVKDRGNAFLPDESREAMVAHHKRIPEDDHWWNVRGPEQGWIHRNLQSIFPTQPIYRSGQVRELEYALDPRIGNFEVDTPDGKWPFRWAIGEDFMTTMGVVILHEGKIAFESYPRMHDYEKVTYWSSTKVLAGAVIRLLEEQGRVDISQPIEYYVPRLADSVHAGTTVQNILDMATGVDCAENYTDPDSCYYLYSEAIGDNLWDKNSPDDPYEFLATVDIERTGEQGTEFVYSGATNFLAAWIVEEVTGAPFADALTKYFWTKIGAEHDAAILAYRNGVSLSHGGFLSTMRDLARLGLLYTPSWGVVSDKQIITDEHITALTTANRPGLRPTAYMWGDRDENGWLSHGGWGGQGFIVHPEKDVVAVFTSYTKQDYSELSTEKALMQVLNSVYGDDE